MALPYIEIDGKKYMSSRRAAELWNKSQGTISKYCKLGKVPKSKCIKDSHNNWYIDINTVYPLSDDEVRKLLTLTLQLKNNPLYSFDWSTFTIDVENIRPIYEYLADMKYILRFQINDSKRLPYDIVLTERGMKLVTGWKSENKIDFNFSNSLLQWSSVVLNLVSLIEEIK
jgi:hypothetical protein